MALPAPVTERSPATGWKGRDFAFVMVAGVLLGGTIYLGGSGLGWREESLLVTSALGQYAGHILGLAALAHRRGGSSTLGFSVEPKDVWYVGLGLFLQVALPLLFFPLANLAGDGDTSQVVSDQIQQLGGLGARLAMALVVGVLAPVAEEVMFRGILLRALAGFGRRIAILVSALMFAGFHLFGLSGDLLRGAILIVPTFVVMGVILGWVTWRQDRLGPAIFVHSGFNVLALLVLLMPPELIDQLVNSQ